MDLNDINNIPSNKEIYEMLLKLNEKHELLKQKYEKSEKKISIQF